MKGRWVIAALVITEGASTASEAACLGVPSVYVNTTRRGYLEDQERRYQLVYNYTDAELAVRKVRELVQAPPRREPEGLREFVGVGHRDGQPHDLVHGLPFEQRAVDGESVLHVRLHSAGGLPAHPRNWFR